MTNLEGHYYFVHLCGGEAIEEGRFRDTYQRAYDDLTKARGEDPEDHLNCVWQVWFELREYDKRMTIATTTMNVLETTP